MKGKPHGKFGAGYGKSIRNEVLAAEAKYKKPYNCPSCSRVALWRVSTGIWKCSKCSAKYAGGAYEWKASQ